MRSRQIKFGAILSYANFGVKMLVQLLYVPIMLKLLGQSEYGVWQLVSSVISYLGLLTFGFGGSYLRFYSQCKGDRKKEAQLNGTYFIIFCVFSLLATIAGTLLAFNLDTFLGPKLTPTEFDLARILVIVMVFNMAISFPISVFSSIILSRELFVVAKMIQLARTILDPLLVIPLLLLGRGSVGMVLVSTALTIFGGMIQIWVVIHKIKAPFHFFSFDISLVREIGAFSFFLFLNSIIDQLNWNVDKFILGRCIGTVAVAVYSVAAQINTIYIQLSDMIATLFAPRVNRIVASGTAVVVQLNQLFIFVGRVQSVIVFLVLLGFLIFGREFIYLWVGAEYIDAYYAALLLIVPASIPLCQTLGVDIQRALNKHQARSVIYGGIAIANLLISIPLAQRWGVIGTALGTTISLLVGNGVIMNILYQKMIGLDVILFWKEIAKRLPSVSIAGVIAVIVKHILPVTSWVLFLFEGIVFVLLYCISVYLFGLNNEEKGMVRNSIMRSSKL